jgi:hypothetical protein
MEGKYDKIYLPDSFSNSFGVFECDCRSAYYCPLSVFVFGGISHRYSDLNGDFRS